LGQRVGFETEILSELEWKPDDDWRAESENDGSVTG
jgi:hypothetical protein